MKISPLSKKLLAFTVLLWILPRFYFCGPFFTIYRSPRKKWLMTKRFPTEKSDRIIVFQNLRCWPRRGLKPFRKKRKKILFVWASSKRPTAGGGSVSVAVSVSDICHVTDDIRYVTHETWPMTPDTWHIKHDMRDLTHDTWFFSKFFFFIVSVLLSTHVEEFSASRKRYLISTFPKALCTVH